MPAKSLNAHDTSDSIETIDLSEELGRVTALIKAQTAIRHGTTLDGLALVRIVRGMTLGEWEALATTQNLENWLGIPLDEDLASSVASLLSLQERLAFQRDHDPLTGIGNRRLFDRRLEVEFERALRSHTELSLLMIDIDNFKRVNDTYGHPCGDVVLQRLAQLLNSSVRPYDLVARVGGEEFCIIFPATSCWIGSMLGNRMLAAFSQEVFQWEDEAFTVTFSGGVSSIALLEGTPTAEKLFQSADDALYAAKRAGKNRITIAHSSKITKDRGSLVQSLEKQLLFSSQDLE